jgi:hypothetical protein
MKGSSSEAMRERAKDDCVEQRIWERCSPFDAGIRLTRELAAAAAAAEVIRTERWGSFCN